MSAGQQVNSSLTRNCDSRNGHFWAEFGDFGSSGARATQQPSMAVLFFEYYKPIHLLGLSILAAWMHLRKRMRPAQSGDGGSRLGLGQSHVFFVLCTPGGSAGRRQAGAVAAVLHMCLAVFGAAYVARFQSLRWAVASISCPYLCSPAVLQSWCVVPARAY